MFLTASETRAIQATFTAMGSAIRITGIASLEIAAFTLVTAVDAYRTARPYLRQAWIFCLWATAFTVALGMATRDLWEATRPLAMQKIDAIVESGYPAKCSESDTELQPDQDVDNEPLESPDQLTPQLLAVTAKTIAQPTLTIKLGIRELRKLATKSGVKGASRMTLAQLAEHGFTS